MQATSPTPLRTPRVVVVGAGVGGLTTAALLAHQGLDVRVFEAAAEPGGKVSQASVGPHQLDAGPTVLTMRWVFDELFESLGLSFGARLGLQRCEVLARHAWGPDRFDLLADLDASVAAIEAFSGADEAGRYLAFCSRAQAVYQTLEQPFLRSTRPNPVSLAWRVGFRRLPSLMAIAPFRTLWQELGHYFRDPRLRQLFGRYATYCGSSPFAAPATLMLVAHVEREAVWQLEGGMQALAHALTTAARLQGVRLDCNSPVQEILLDGDRACGVRLRSGEVVAADVVVFNGDARALQAGLLGAAVGVALGAQAALQRSLSALTWHFEAQVSGFALSHHNVFFSDPGKQGYRREFEAIERGQLPASPTVYLCAQDRSGQRHGPGPRGPERLMCLVNAPAEGSSAAQGALSNEEMAVCQERMFDQLGRAGLKLELSPHPLCVTRPSDFAQRFPGSAGALYGPSSRGWRASFQRPAQTTRIPGLFLAGGTVHPGPGVPMAALSGRLAAMQIIEALASTHRLHPVVMPGGMPMR